jgi:hypothetical protein
MFELDKLDDEPNDKPEGLLYRRFGLRPMPRGKFSYSLFHTPVDPKIDVNALFADIRAKMKNKNV